MALYPNLGKLKELKLHELKALRDMLQAQHDLAKAKQTHIWNSLTRVEEEISSRENGAN